MRKVAGPIRIIALGLGWSLAGVEAWLLAFLIRERGRTLLKDESVSERLTNIERALLELATQQRQPESQPAEPSPHPSPSGLPVGSEAPAFTLPDLSGEQRSLSDFSGEAAALIFFSPDCGYCQQLAPQLGQLQAGSRRLIVISRGEAERNRQLAETNAWNAEVLLDATSEVGGLYRVYGTPMAYAVDAEGRISSELAVGAQAILEMIGRQPNAQDGKTAELTAASLAEKQDAAVRRMRDAGMAVTESRLNRSGLTAGAKAPDFKLPDLQGNERSLTAFRGNPVLLVFSDIDCVPCQALAPSLEKLYRERSGVQVVMVSRGDHAANRRKAQEHGITFPILLQRHWEVSSQYGIFATPVAYLIDGDGALASGVAIGGDAILELARKASELLTAPSVR